jgi:hypothetical protein
MSDNPKSTVTFIDSGREPQCPPNPDFPEGMEIDLSNGERPACGFKIPYPAPRCGVMVAHCGDCGRSAGVTVAGRVDDPKFVTFACRPKPN